jgi:hypothetical protein
LAEKETTYAAIPGLPGTLQTYGCGDTLRVTIGELFLGFGSGNGQGGADFSPLLLKRIGECGLMLSLDLYPPSIDEEGDEFGNVT